MTHIKIRHDGSRWTLTADGHAGYDRTGKDIVCAGCSALCYAVTGAILDMDAEGGCAAISLDFPSSPGVGHCSLSVVPQKGFEARTEGIMAVAVNGFKLLESTYPRFVEINFSNRGSE